MEVEKDTSEPIAQPTKAKREKTSDDTDFRKVFVPSHRYTPLKDNWMKIFEPVVEHLKLQIRFNLKTRNVEIKAGKDTEDIANLQKAADFVRAFILGFALGVLVFVYNVAEVVHITQQLLIRPVEGGVLGTFQLIKLHLMLLLLIVSRYKSRIRVLKHISSREQYCANSFTEALLASIIASVGPAARHKSATLRQLVASRVRKIMVTESV